MKPDHESPKNPRALTRALQAWSTGSSEARDQVFEEVYAELRSLASLYLKNESRARLSMQPTLLVNEVYLRLARPSSPWQDRHHFFGVAAQAMRRILVDHARRRGAQKRSLPLFVTTPPGSLPDDDAELDVIRLDAALARLAVLDERQARVVELRYFAGLTIEETAEAVGASTATIKREWRTARAFLMRELRDEGRAEKESS
jgi:RNA polymerase sigma factor (TIGR02999 family)